MTETFEVSLERIEDFQFRADFRLPAVDPLVVDEPPPLGEARGPNPSQLLAAAVADCLSSSLLFSLQKSHLEVSAVRASVLGRYRRNERGRLRVGSLEVTIEVGVEGAHPARLKKCLEMFEDFCVVTESVRKGIDVSVTVNDLNGTRLHPRATGETEG